MRIRTGTVVVLCALLPVAPLAATPGPTVTVAAVFESGDGDLSVRRWVVPSNGQGDFVRKLDDLAPVLAVGVESRRHALADPRRNEQWGLARLDVDSVRELGTGRGVVVAVVDTGVDGSHPELQHAVLPGIDLVGDGDGRTDPNGHGTHVAGIIAAAVDGSGTEGLAPDVKILPVRVLDREGSGDDAVIAQGILWAVRNGAQVINLSLGGTDRDPLLADAVERAVTGGVIVVAAAGNTGESGDVMYPAAHPTVLAVGATGPDDRTAIFSTRGDYVDIAAPGSMILSTFPGSQYRYESGTSMAAPFVSAAAAVLIGRSWSSSDALARLLASTYDIDSVGSDRLSGNGIIDLFAALTTGRPRQDQPRPVGSPSIPTLSPLPAPTLPELTRPALPPAPELLRPILPSVPALPDTVLPRTPALPPQPAVPVTPDLRTPTVPSRPEEVTRRLAPMSTVMDLTARRSGTRVQLTVSLHSSRYPLAFRRVDVVVNGRGGQIRRQLRTDASGKVVVVLDAPSARTATAKWSGDAVTAPAHQSVAVSN